VVDSTVLSGERKACGFAIPSRVAPKVILVDMIGYVARLFLDSGRFRRGRYQDFGMLFPNIVWD
jgi:hypothetical protein